MKLAIHQPNYLPWPGYFHKMESADVFLILDTVQYVKFEYDNRCKIKTPRGEQWLTVPVGLQKSGTLTRDVNLPDGAEWKLIQKRAILNNYSKTLYYKDYRSEINEIFDTGWKKLSDLNIKLIHAVREWLGIDTPLKFASELPESTLKGTGLILSYCQELGVDVYLSGAGGKNYLEQEQFKNNNIKLEFQDFTPIVYPQRFGDFIPNLSVIDLLFNCGKESLSRIMGKYKNE